MTRIIPKTSIWATKIVLLLNVVALMNHNAEAWSSTRKSDIYRSTVQSASIVRRQANLASEIIMSQIKEEEQRKMAAAAAEISSLTTTATAEPPRQGKRKIPRSERKALERQKKANNVKNPNKKKANTKNYKLHSNAVSQLTHSSTAEDVVKAIKRAQKNHDHHDLRVIANFLIDECDVGFAYGYRGSLLARLAVAALRWENHAVAKRAIEIRRLEYRASMQPMESAAIIRGLLRVHNVTDALDMIADELSLPLEVGTVSYFLTICCVGV